MSADGIETLFLFLKCLLVFVPIGLVPVMIFLERKGAAIIQDRPGPNRSAISLPFGLKLRGFGFVHNFSDMIKLIMKEDFVPRYAHKVFYILAPAIPVATALLTPSLIPWFAPMAWQVGDDVARISGQVLDSQNGLLLLFAFNAVGIYGIVLGSWASNSKFSLLGGMRASAMMISYEVSMGLAVLGMFLLTSSFSLTAIVEWQAAHAWGIVVQPVAFFLFVTAMFAETGRTPFDVIEGESEIVGGFHTEYSSFKFALFFMGEYAHVVIASALIATIFLGGYHLPFLGTEVIRGHIGLVLCGVLLATAALFVLLALMVRKQRRRYAQLDARDRAIKLREYGFFLAVFSVAAVVFAVAGFAALAIPAPQLVVGVYPWWANLLGAAVQFGIVMAKTLFFCWVFVWARWTLPRFRYDHIMSLGWKVLLNVALVNLLVTALIAKLVQGGGHG